MTTINMARFESGITFKVYTFWNEKEKPEVRRFTVPQTTAESYFQLTEKLLQVYPGLKDRDYTISWKDEEDDNVVISSDGELKTAVHYSGSVTIKLYINCKTIPKQNESKAFKAPPSAGCPKMPTLIPGMMPAGLHFGVVCDSCDNPIVGFRYKCTVCDDFDLCSQCEAAGCHPDHCMVRVPTPHMPRDLIKAAIKRSRSFLKTVASNIPEECPYSKRRRDKSGERKHRGHHGGHHGGEHHRRQRPSWLETFATYMNEFANLAGDIDPKDDQPPAQKPQDGQEKAKTANQSTSPSAPPPQQSAPSTSANVQTECPFVPPNANVENIKGFLQMFLKDMQESVANATVVPPQDAEMGQGDRKTPEPVKVNTETSAKSDISTKSSETPKSGNSRASSISAEQYKDASPEKADDWTMINKERDLIDMGAASAEPNPPIGFNLPEEFQERVRITTDIYPPLNTATAVLDPKVPETHAAAPPTAPEPETAAAPVPPKPVPAKPAPAAPQPRPTSQPQPQQMRPTPRMRHPKPHIDAAIDQMLAMGFTNDGGWLTQLLESKDGNIAAVLDLLTPVNPKK